jgi:hypothetical protein
MRSLDWDFCIKALISILDKPSAEKGYQDLKDYYLSNDMEENASAIDFLLKNKFNGNVTDINKK